MAEGGKMVLKEKVKLSKDRLRALFAISSRAGESRGPCPDVNDLAAFMDGGLTSKERETIMAHLDACPTCYNEWLAASAALSDKGRAGMELHAYPETAEEKHNPWFGNRSNLIAYGLALAACLILFFWLPVRQQSDLPGVIKTQYQFVLEHTIMPDDSIFLTDFEGRPKGPVLRGYGFVDAARQHSPAAGAFVSGIRNGWGLIQSKADFFDTGTRDEKWDDYYRLGLWYALVTSVCGSGEKMPDSFWDTQKEIIETFERLLSSRVEKESEAVVLTRSLGRIKSLFSQQEKDETRTCRSVRQELEVIIEGIAS